MPPLVSTIFPSSDGNIYEVLVLDVRIDTIPEKIEAAQRGVEFVKAAYGLSDTEIQAFREPIIDKLADSLPGTLKVLDALVKIHPFVAGRSSS